MNRKKVDTDRPSEIRVEYDRTWARCTFFRAMERVAPEVIKDLRNRLLPRFLSIAPANEEEVQAVLHGRGEEELTEQLMPVVEEWGMEYRLADPEESTTEDEHSRPHLLNWLEPVVVYSFMRWSRQSDATPIQWYFQDTYSVAARLEDPPPFRFEFEG